MSDWQEPPPTSKEFNENVEKFLIFIGKTLVVAFVATGVVLFTVNQIKSSLFSSLFDLKSSLDGLGGQEFWSGVERELARAADPNSIPPAHKERILQQIKAASANYAPFVRAVIEGAQEPKLSPTP